MFRPEPMLKIRLLLLASEAQDAALQLARLGSFSPASLTPDELREATAATYRESWLEARARLDKLLEHFTDLKAVLVPDGAEAPSLADLQELNTWLGEVWQQCSNAYENELRADQDRRHLDSVEETLNRLVHLDMDLTPLLDPDCLLNVQLGSLPFGSVVRMHEALSITGHLMSVFDRDAEQSYAVIAGPRQRAGEVRGLLAQAGWRELTVPAELRAHPNAAREWLKQERARVDDSAKSQCHLLGALREHYLERLLEARVRLALARPLAEAALTGVRGQGGLVALAGWVPRRRLATLRTLLEGRFHGRCWLSVQEPAATESRDVPSLVHYPAWLLPFVPLVKSYGVPRYGEFDPTLPFALTYLFLFGAMFGDLGHGAVILALSIGLRRRLGRAMWVGVAAGGVSMLFGLLYGSVFGYEELLPALWLSPLHHPNQVLTLAVCFGATFIVLTLLVNTRNKLAAGHVSQALFDSAGLAGLLFYLGALGAVANMAGAAFGKAAGMLALLGLATVAAYKWHETRAGLGERLLVTGIETLETGINLFANTLSFMRVAAFSLNHAALALAVFTLAAGLGAAGHGLTIVLGNVIIIVLEGGIVAIQALRLMYYEGFSRFYSGDGTEFVPLRLTDAKPV